MQNVSKHNHPVPGLNPELMDGTSLSPLINDTDDRDATNLVAIPQSRSTKGINAQVADAVENDRHCTLTIGEAQMLFVQHLRRPLSSRSLQRYCKSGDILAQIISHSQGKEWMINEPSLIEFISRYAITLQSNDTNDNRDMTRATETPPRAPDVGETRHPDTLHTAVPTPTERIVPTAPAPVAPMRDIHAPAPPTATPEPTLRPHATPDGDDSNDKRTGQKPDETVDPTSVGESRRVGELLIENSRLTALLEGKNEVITTLKAHDEHNCEQLKQSQSLISKLSGDVARIASQMLQTMESIGGSNSKHRLKASDLRDDRDDEEDFIRSISN